MDSKCIPLELYNEIVDFLHGKVRDCDDVITYELYENMSSWVFDADSWTTTGYRAANILVKLGEEVPQEWIDD